MSARLWRVRVEAYLPDGSLKARWEGVPLVRRGPVRVIAARWQRAPIQAGPLRFHPGDTLIEWFSAEAWFNVYQVVAPGGRVRGWYVNLARPQPPLGSSDDECWTYTDLALDFAVTRSAVAVLDEDAAEQVLAALPPGQAARARREAQRLRALLAAAPAAVAFLEGLFAQGLSPGEEHLLAVAARWGPPAASCFARIDLGDDEPGGGAGWYRFWRQGARVAEAIAVVVRDGRVLVHRKASYPHGTVRLLGGGVVAGERPDDAAVRELREETGLEAEVRRWLAFVRWEIGLPNGTGFPMPNYVFQLADDGRAPRPSAEEGITELRWVPAADLLRIAAQLRDLPGRWAPWGIYRAAPHELAAVALGTASARAANARGLR